METLEDLRVDWTPPSPKAETIVGKVVEEETEIETAEDADPEECIDLLNDCVWLLEDILKWNRRYKAFTLTEAEQVKNLLTEITMFTERYPLPEIIELLENDK